MKPQIATEGNINCCLCSSVFTLFVVKTRTERSHPAVHAHLLKTMLAAMQNLRRVYESSNYKTYAPLLYRTLKKWRASEVFFHFHPLFWHLLFGKSSVASYKHDSVFELVNNTVATVVYFQNSLIKIIFIKERTV